jgi:hypothetical protein
MPDDRRGLERVPGDATFAYRHDNDHWGGEPPPSIRPSDRRETDRAARPNVTDRAR